MSDASSASRAAHEQLVINDGTTQFDRAVAQIDPREAQIDERSLSDLLRFVEDFSHLIKFYRLDDAYHGETWVDLFTDDPTMTLANISTIDLPLAQREIDALYLAVSREGVEPLRMMFELVVELARDVDRWYRGLSTTPTPGSARTIVTAIRGAIASELGEAMRQLEGLDAGARDALGEPLGLDYTGFSPLWGLGEPCANSAAYGEGSDIQKSERVRIYPRTAFSSFQRVINDLILQANDNLYATLGGGLHHPQIALAITFCELFTRAQAALNANAERYPDFYYRDILRMTPAAAEPDRGYLTFTLAEGHTRTRVPAGTRFDAGTDEHGGTLIYASEDELEVSAAELVAVNTLQVVYDGPQRATPARVFETRVELLELRAALASDSEADALALSFSTFGHDTLDEDSEFEVTTLASFGLVVSTPVLALAGGARMINVVVHWPQPPSVELPPAAAASLLERGFALSVTTAEGWAPVASFKAKVSDAGFTLSFTLPPTFPALAALASEAGGSRGPPVSEPALELRLLQEATSSGTGSGPTVLAYVSSFAIASLSLRCEVEGLGDLTLENTDGQVDASHPFLVFGAQPVPGAFVRLRSHELFDKVIDKLSLAITWFDLPPNEDGFAGYYSAYDVEPAYANSSFEVALTLLHEGGPWRLAPLESSAQQLFQPSEGALDVRSSFTCDRDHTYLGPDPYYDPLDNGIELRLSAPAWGFGADLYAKSVMKAALEQMQQFAPARAGESTGAAIDYPNPPMSPSASVIEIDYSSTSAVFSGGQPDARARLFRLLPFGGYELLTDDAFEDGTFELLPALDASALYLGLRALAPRSPLTLLFQMAATKGSERPSPVTWASQTRTGWHELAEGDIAADGTAGLSCGGVLSLVGVGDVAVTTRLPGDLRWLRATTPHSPGVFPRISRLEPHVATVRSQGTTKDAHDRYHQLPAHTIREAIDPLPDLATITQPLPTSDGRAAETTRGFWLRASERLRHKSRALQRWDYERLVLEHHPFVWKVRALPTQGRSRGGQVGKVLVVIVPKPSALDNHDPSAPLATQDQLVRIRETLSSRLSAFANVEVVNPNYVRLTVDACVSLVDSDDPKGLLSQLNDELVAYLSPGFYDLARALTYGAYATQPKIASFIRSRPYVTYIKTLAIEGLDRPAPPSEPDWCFRTSARTHRLSDGR